MKFPLVLRSSAEKKAARQAKRIATLKSRVSKTEEKVRKREQTVQELKDEHARLRAQYTAAPSQTGEGGRAVARISGHDDIRPLFAMRLSGEGIEIGALHNPLPVPEGVTVRYVDIRTREQHIAKFSHLPAEKIVETSFLCDGQTLSAVPDDSQDFVISNHMLEHCVNPLLALKNFIRVLKPLGRIFISLPDKRFTFDHKRPATPWEHVLHDFQINRAVEERATYEEFRDLVNPAIDVDEALANRREIHHHAWTQSEILELFIQSKRVLGWPLEIELFAKQGCEVVLVLRKSNPPHEDHALFAKGVKPLPES